MLLKKGKHFLPTINGLSLAIVGAMMIKETVTGVIIAVELMIFAVFL